MLLGVPADELIKDETYTMDLLRFDGTDNTDRIVFNTAADFNSEIDRSVEYIDGFYTEEDLTEMYDNARTIADWEKTVRKELENTVYMNRGTLDAFWNALTDKGRDLFTKEVASRLMDLIESRF